MKARHLKKISPFFLPHPQTHKKAHLLSWHALLIYLLLFVLLRTGLDVVSVYKPGVLGVNSQITIQQIIEDTNIERQKDGLPPLMENSLLDEAASRKAQNMFEENYWAHFSPSGKDPWGFILGAGYKFSYAGENLARNFYTSEDVVQAWMNSPSHRDNLLNSHYQDIGIAVVDGVLQGQKTTLVVQEFGRSLSQQAALPTPQVNVGGKKIEIPAKEVAQSTSPVLVASIYNPEAIAPAAVDPALVIRFAGISLMLIISLLLMADFIVLRRRGVFRISSHHLAHLSLLAITGSAVFTSSAGSIL
ncbi:MAG: CAP domain-containing protein [Patescibacteria group bacterium]|nr:CAP domain-containing protein [Patescibacteria group bacterium]